MQRRERSEFYSQEWLDIRSGGRSKMAITASRGREALQLTGATREWYCRPALPSNGETFSPAANQDPSTEAQAAASWQPTYSSGFQLPPCNPDLATITAQFQLPPETRALNQD